MKNSIIVTVKTNRDTVDMELPCLLPIKELSKLLLNAMQTLEPTQFGRMNGIWIIHNGKYLLDETASLSDYGIVDGDYISIAEMKDSY